MALPGHPGAVSDPCQASNFHLGMTVKNVSYETHLPMHSSMCWQVPVLIIKHGWVIHYIILHGLSKAKALISCQAPEE